jgi:hypothetical protein
MIPIKEIRTKMVLKSVLSDKKRYINYQEFQANLRADIPVMVSRIEIEDDWLAARKPRFTYFLR